QGPLRQILGDRGDRRREGLPDHARERRLRRHMRSFLLSALSFLIATDASGQGKPFPVAAVDTLAGRVMKEFRVPGISLAVVRDGKTLLARGYGVRRMGDPALVD